MNKKKDFHHYPPLLHRYPFLIHLLFGWHQLILLRNWHVAQHFDQILKKLARGGRVLDAGFGEGQHLFPFARKFGEIEFVGLDRVVANTAFGEVYKKFYGLSNVEFVHEDLVNYTPSERFDVVLCVGVLPYVEDGQALINSIFDLTQIGGRFVLYTPIEGRVVLPFFKKLVENSHTYDKTHQKYRNFSQAEVVEMLENAGFQLEKKVITYGTFGIISHELYLSLNLIGEILPKWLGVLWWFILLAFIPISLIINTLDYFTSQKRGNGLLIISKK